MKPGDLKQGDILITGGGDHSDPVNVWLVTRDTTAGKLVLVQDADRRRAWDPEMFVLQYPLARLIPFKRMLDLVFM